MGRAVIIGGGLAGMSAALLFRKLGHEALVVEKHFNLGPLVRGFQRQGLFYDTGFHYAGGLGPDGILQHYLKILLLMEQGLEIQPLPDPGGETLRFSDQDILISQSFAQYRNLFPPVRAMDDFFSASRAVFRKSPYLNPNAEHRDLIAIYDQDTTLANRLAPLGLSSVLQTALTFRCLLYGVRPAEASFTEFSLVNVPYWDGTYTFKGGGLSLVLAFEKAMRKAGVQCLLGAEAVKIITDKSNSVVAVEVDDSSGRQEVACDFCLYTGSPKALPGLLPEKAIRPVLARRMLNIKETAPAFMAFGRTKSRYMEKRHFFLCAEPELDSWFEPVKETVYVGGGVAHDGFCPVLLIAGLKPQATDPWLYSKPGARPGDYLAFKELKAHQLRAAVLRCCPELGGDLQIVDSATDLTLNQYSFNYGRGLYGKLHSLAEAPILPLTRVGRFALAGQNIIMPGLLGVLVSSALAVGMLLGHECVLEGIYQ